MTFANDQQRILKQYPFFPSFYLPHTSTNTFEQLLKAQQMERHQILSHPQSIQIIASTFDDLKKIAQKIHAQTHYYPVLIEPERQFLLMQNWRYFQSFDTKLNPLPHSFDNTKMEGIAEGIHATLQGLHTHNPSMANTLVQRIVLSHELFLPPSDVTFSLAEQVETLLENHFFVSHIPKPIHSAKPIDQNWNQGTRDQAMQLIWKTPLGNEGNCECCKPRSMVESHIHASTRIPCTITQDGVYIHTNDEHTSNQYHATNPNKERRIARAKEFGLPTIPMGPFSRNQSIMLPLNEAIQGTKDGIITLSFSPTHALWSCKNKSFAMQRLHAQLNERMLAHSRVQNALIQPYLTQYQLAYTQHAGKNPVIKLHSQAEKNLREWTLNLPRHILYQETAWRDPQLTDRITAGISQ